MSSNLSGQRVLITGAGKGIGRQIALTLHTAGARVVALSRSLDDLHQLQREIGCDIVTCDLSDAAQARTAAEAAGPVDLLVNNAGISIPQPFLEATPDAFDRTLAVNVRSAMILSQVVAKAWIARRHAGAIVNVSSQASLAALTDHATYCASKGALDALTRVMALELGPHGIRVNAINPTVTLTPMGEMAWGDPAKSGPMLAKIPLGRFARPEHVADVVAFLLSAEASMISGTALPIDGGFLAT